MRTNLLITFLLISFGISAQTNTEESSATIHWLSLEEALELQKKADKPLLIDIYTDWCGWCKHMDKTTYANPSMAQYINRFFYPVKLDAEGKDTIRFEGKTYASIPGQKSHPLAQKLLEGHLSYPTTLFLANENRLRLRVPGYLDVKKMESFLIYFSENAYRTTTINEFRALFSQTFEETTLSPENKPGVNWMTFEEAERAMQKKDRKTLILLTTNWSNTGKMMQTTTLSDSSVVHLINEKYLAVTLNAQSQDTIQYLGKSFLNAGPQAGNFHQLALALSNGRIALPSLIVLNEKGQLINRTPFFLGPKITQTLLEYFADDTYLHEKWQDFQKKKASTN